MVEIFDMDDIEKMNTQVENIDNKIRELNMQKELILSSISIKQDDNASFIEHLAKAVDYGYLGDYGFIGPAYGGGLYGLSVDIDKAKHYLEKFYYDYKLSRLEKVSADSIIVALYNLAATEVYICDRDELMYTPEITGKMVAIYKEIVNIAEIVEKPLEESALLDLFNVGVILYSGKFGNTKEETIFFASDIETGLKGIKKAAQMGSKEAMDFIKAEELE
ncbi:hypothetical protein SAMN02910298_00225 [Pseudobutyrivibrio sp. YE44]|uniref:hypothetical protein n=1 Tax=Pseudobutyrivibrio sp. YE44 TaxID=1520802 RepID=UPI00087EFF55|nr:hypothetical protein [Pseudobutyrivibrio sp. YE44]SDB07149.1 hypothetical protein SAMN02910298_00225 [Pseudobutyrivibrio sp. YE44]